MPLPFLDLRKKTAVDQVPLREAFERVLASKGYILGDEGKAFEQEWAGDLGLSAELTVGCNSGTDALVLAMKAMGVAAGSEVIVPAHTAVPTVAAIRSLGAIPRFAEVDADTWVMNTQDALSLVSPKTKAIIPVHLYGNCVDLKDLAGVRNLVLEDVAQAQGATYLGQALGTWGRAGAFSFYPTKNLAALGDGGGVICREADDATKMRLLRFYGQRNRNYADLDGGVNSRLDELQAAFLRVRLKTYRAELARKAGIRALYQAALDGLPLQLQTVTEGCVPAWHLFVVSFATRLEREKAQKAFEDEEIGALVHYPVPNHQQPAFAAFRDRALPITESLCERILSLPFHGQLTEADVGAVSGALRRALRT